MQPAVLSFQSMMNSIMDAVATNEIVDIITKIFWNTWEFTIQLILAPVYELIYSLYISMLNFIWVLEQSFDMFAGTQDIYVTDVAGNVVGQADFWEPLRSASFLPSLP